MGTVYHARFGGTEVEEAVTDIEAQRLCHIKSVGAAERLSEAFNDKVFSRNLSLRVAPPQVDVCLPVVVVEGLWVVEIALQVEFLERLAQGDDGIAVGVVECITEVGEQVFVFFFFIFGKDTKKNEITSTMTENFLYLCSDG